MTAFETILVEKASSVAKVTLNRPEVLNAINERMLEELVEALEDVAQDPSSRVLILTGAGRAFCAAADIEEERRGSDRLMGHLSQQEIVGLHPTRSATDRAAAAHDGTPDDRHGQRYRRR